MQDEMNTTDPNNQEKNEENAANENAAPIDNSSNMNDSEKIKKGENTEMVKDAEEAKAEPTEAENIETQAVTDTQQEHENTPAAEENIPSDDKEATVDEAYLSAIDLPFKEQLSINDEGALILNNPARSKPANLGIILTAAFPELMRKLNNNYEALQKEYVKLNDMWDQLKDKLRTRSNISAFNKSLEEIEALGDFVEMLKSVEDKNRTINELLEVNANERNKIIEEAISISGSTDWKKTSERYNELLAMWKEGPEVKKSVHDDLWEQFKNAKNSFHLRRQEHFEEQEKDHMINLDKKIELCEQAESLSNSQEWKKTTEKMNALLEEWKSIGHLPSGHKNEEMWERFNNAKKHFFENKREHGAKIKEEQEANLALKNKLVERVEEICNSKDWKATSDEMDELQKKWTAIGRVPAEQNDLLWNRWRAARDTFYNAKRTHTETFVANLEENYERKKVITERAEKISNSMDWRNTTDELMSMMEEWKTIGPVPKSYGDDLWIRFNKARRDFFKRKDEDREQRQKLYEKRMVSRMNQTEQFLYTLKGELKEDESRLEEFRTSLANPIGDSKKELELKANLERLVKELEESIPRKKEKITEVEGQLAVINKKNNEEKK